ncbi:hypothetical protein [Streptomyces sp. NEAU-S7GS2]|uniref:hypothetical protein n=1 Tax=Streptomyces sp. NEAU-S7GS2 TaxID=2202000 RepID=UPI000D6F4E66|nr:hypothetical protein [Streptomyces sp. NEAU-S7GS2]AWN24775.1 hypothetical protein DKG71_00015 [Streptomyces sp. NEAU-S7GS2]
MGASSTSGLSQKLRTLQSFKSNGIEGHDFGVCALPKQQGKLTDEEYAAYLAAAEGKHDTYMRHGAPFASGDLAYEVIVNGTVVAWIPYDGVPRVIDRNLGDEKMHLACDLARASLGDAPETQQMLADARGEIELLSPNGFTTVIYEHLERAARGSKFNDFPPETSVREYFRVRTAQARANAEKTATQRGWTLRSSHVYVPNPTVEYTDQQRRAWALEAARYLAAYQDKFPTSYTLWVTNQHHAAHRDAKARKPLQIQPGDRVGFMDNREMKPAVILSVVEQVTGPRADIRTAKGDLLRQPIDRRNVTPEEELLPETRALFAPAWDRLAVTGNDESDEPAPA